MLQIWTLCIILLFTSMVYAEGATDPACVDNCNCCVDQECHSRFGWDNVCTNGCIDGHQGARCYKLCQSNCISCEGDLTKCVKCNDGFYLGTNKDCKSECPSNCLTCTSTTVCTSCKEGYVNQGGSTTCQYSTCPVNCECNTGMGDCVACKNGYYDTSISCSNTCPDTCSACSSLDICNNCRDGFYNGYELDDNTKTMLNNCTFKCRDKCTQCQSYDNCLQCVDGKYGDKCLHDCSEGCKDQTCNIKTGNCICSTNFIGDKCATCSEGYYGPSCSQSCSSYCRNSKCDKSTGLCSDGCISETIIGETCNKCKVGMFGEFCDKVCPKNCLGMKCDRRNGSCSDGCENNFQGRLCDDCKPGKYGTNCDISCSDKCVNSLCNKDNGNCLSCFGNFDGNECTKCKPGYYGFTCSDSCSEHCNKTTCSMSSGVCDYGCKNDYSGDKCCLLGLNCKTCVSDVKCQECISGFYGELCEYTCNTNCIDSCEIFTGACNYCFKNTFGPFCGMTCSKNCLASNSSVGRRCASSEGTCIYGCKDGFYGRLCNQTCSRLCKDNICLQESGICLKGCTQSNNDFVCSFKLGNVADSNSSQVSLITLATLLSLAVTALVAFTVKVIYRKIRAPSSRALDESRMKVTVGNTLTQDRNQYELNQGEIATARAANIDYENFVKVRNSAEHPYNTVNGQSEESMANVGNTDYMNIQVHTP